MPPHTWVARLFNCLVVGLGLCGLLTCGLFVATLGRSWQSEQDWRNLRQTLHEQEAIWQANRPSAYTVTYSNCNSLFCCQNVPLSISVNEEVAEVPTCAQNGYGTTYTDYAYYNGYNYVFSMRDMFRWLDDWTKTERTESLEIIYHPQSGAIERVTFEPWQGANPVVIEYSSLRAEAQ